MTGKRTRYLADFKAKVALDGLATVFSGKADAKEGMREEDVEKLHAKIGQLVVERDFLAKASGR